MGYYPDSFDYEWNPLDEIDKLNISNAELAKAQKHVLLKGCGNHYNIPDSKGAYKQMRSISLMMARLRKGLNLKTRTCSKRIQMSDNGHAVTSPEYQEIAAQKIVDAVKKLNALPNS